jgi:hypothetical protein
MMHISIPLTIDNVGFRSLAYMNGSTSETKSILRGIAIKSGYSLVSLAENRGVPACLGTVKAIYFLNTKL